ncbi:MAG: adenine nucleotide alpha hydrolase, partial [Alphaproteobacteria bacterium]
TLAALAQRHVAGEWSAYHAISPAVPPRATARVRRQAEQEGWPLKVIDAAELADARYRENPVNRCFYCKINLYGTIRSGTEDQIVSGANLDDLNDFRPGLEAAWQHGVRHPYVEAGIDKETVRSIAAALGLNDLSELPSAPCLSSRVETGIPIYGEALAAIDRAERLVERLLRPRTVRCRLRADAIVVELDEAAHAALDGSRGAAIGARIAAYFGETSVLPVKFAPYRQGSAFLHAGGVS